MCVEQGNRVVDRLEGADPAMLTDKVMAVLLLCLFMGMFVP